MSSAEQAASGAGLEAQRASIATEACRRGWDLVAVFEDAGASGRTLNGRPGLSEAQGAVERGEADALVVTRVDRLSRSLMDFAGIVERSQRRGWTLVVLDIGVHTGTPTGEMLANVLAVFAQFERKLIGQRTAEALAVKRAQGVRLGRPRVIGEDVRSHVRRRRKAGLTLRAIAEELDLSGVPTAHGARRWAPESVRKLLLQRDLRKR